jgi:phospholipase/lecithinase/hemolysin
MSVLSAKGSTTPGVWRGSIDPVRSGLSRPSGSPRWIHRGFPLTVALVGAAFVLGGCSSSSGGTKSAFAVPNPYVVGSGTSIDEVQVRTLRVFGDSYSIPDFKGTPTWQVFLQAQGTVRTRESYAIGGAPAASTRDSAFNRQLDTWLAANKPIADSDLTVAYFGYNDIRRFGNTDGFAAARTGYQQGVARLVANGAANENRRLFLTQIHDWSANPGVLSSLRGQVITWNAFVAEQANAYPNVIAVDLFTVFDRVYAKPEEFGFVNVTTVDAQRAAIDALYLDDIHFGPKGQQVIARVYRHYLTRGWDWANRTSAGADSVRRLSSDLDQGLLSLRLAGDAQPVGGVQAFTFGTGVRDGLNPGVQQGPGLLSWEREEVGAGLQGTGGFALAYQPMMSHRAASDQRFGVSVARYDGSVGQMDLGDWGRSEYTTDAVAAYWQQGLDGVLATTQVSYLKHRFDGRASDGILGLVTANQGEGSTWALEQRLSRPSDLGFGMLVPWVSVSHLSHELAPDLARSLYTTDVQFGGSRADEWMGELGLDMQLAPIRISGGKNLLLSGSARYLSSLNRDDIEVTMTERAAPDIVQRETILRDRLERVGLGLGATLALSDDLRVGATLAATAEGGKVNESVGVTANYRF